MQRKENLIESRMRGNPHVRFGKRVGRNRLRQLKYGAPDPTSRNLVPSDQDKDLTDRLIQVGRILNIDVIEHLIISPKSYFSFVDTGLMEQLAQSNKWVPKFELIERIRKEEQKIREELILHVEKQAKIKEEKALKKGVKEGIAKGKIEGKKEGEQVGIQKGRIEMAKGLLKDGVSIEIIAKNSGLTKAEITKLK